MLVSWMLNTIEPTLRSTITYMEIAKDLWEDIKERFSIANGPRVQQIKAELANCKQRDLLYGAVRSNILSTNPLPNWNKAYSLVCQEERVRNISRGKEERGEVVSFAVKTNTGGRNLLGTRNGGVTVPKGLDVGKGDRVQGVDVAVQRR
ncbi:hypothetical protein Salat_2721800 [Sesamum alatum]|uniref:Uncharacterized protein n=1 Tax=Sesamum alatum TaxID=300844 RepID=A0AAE1XR73_9LAMI|nr:hypothetical protein Salat_2721800 [Sesamum alatum]